MFRIIPILLLYSVYACSIFNYNLINQPICTDWSKIAMDEYEINNNVWGKESITNYSQCIFSISSHKETETNSIGWSWDWPKVYDGVKAYPSILYGHKPWNTYSTTQYLPEAIEQLKHIMVTYNLKKSDTGAVNLLLESWITKDEVPTPDNRVGELAIQLYQKNWPGQAGEYIESTVINGISFDFYLEKKFSNSVDKHVWAYYGFVHQGTPVLKAKVDIMKFINYLVKHGYVDKNHFIATVELGNEVDYGKGRTEIDYFTVQVEK